MSKTHPLYAAEFRQRMLELARAGRALAQLSREFGITVQIIATGSDIRKFEAMAPNQLRVKRCSFICER